MKTKTTAKKPAPRRVIVLEVHPNVLRKMSADGSPEWSHAYANTAEKFVPLYLAAWRSLGNRVNVQTFDASGALISEKLHS